MTPNRTASALDAFIDLEPHIEDFRDEVLTGLASPRKRIPSKFFYDETGSRLFERICALPEYYPTRTEIEILTGNADALGALLPAGASVIEFGSGSAKKIRCLVRALRSPQCHVPIDISRTHLLDNAESFAREHPAIRVAAVCADFTQPVELNSVVPAGPRIGFFPGSTIGNLTPDEAVTFLKTAARTLGSGAFLVIGVDLKKDQAVLEAAYNDAEGVTAAFNLNLLRRINRELAGTFELRDFAHRAHFDGEEGRIEMHLESLRDHGVTVAGEPVRFEAGETIHTENSYKYTVAAFEAIATEAGFREALILTDPRDLFSIHCLEAI